MKVQDVVSSPANSTVCLCINLECGRTKAAEGPVMKVDREVDGKETELLAQNSGFGLSMREQTNFKFVDLYL